jgi:hypothetical protein
MLQIIYIPILYKCQKNINILLKKENHLYMMVLVIYHIVNLKNRTFIHIIVFVV